MYHPADLLEAARSIRPLLPTLIEAEANSLDQQLAELLNQATPEDMTTAEAILTLLQSHPATQDWLAEFLKISPMQKGVSYQTLPGSPALQPAPRYICPIANDYTWYLEAGEEIPLCKTHLVPLVPAQP
jgi:hypothetical protein